MASAPPGSPCTGLLVAPQTTPSQGYEGAVPSAWDRHSSLASWLHKVFAQIALLREVCLDCTCLSVPSEHPLLPDTVLSTVCLPDGTVSSIRAGV